jgi:Fanconi anemia group M protein
MATAGGESQHVDHPLVEAGAVERREYQLQLAERAAVADTLVCLPTGLGKTAVSLLVTAERLHQLGGKALLLAPTKPLVAQHADDYRAWLTVPDDEIVVFTGEVRPEDRAAQWSDATIVIATPQVIENDLIGGRISLSDVVHLTFDECHRATGDYAYTYIAERYHDDAEHPLVTGLSASPGGDAEEILAVCENLGFTDVEVMTEEDADIGEFAHGTDVDWQHVELPEAVLEIRDALNEVITERLENLKSLGVIDRTDPALSQSELDQVRGRLQGLIDSGESAGYEGMSAHAEVMKLRRAVELVETQSVDALRRYFDRQREAARSSGASKAAQRFVSDPRVKLAMELADEYDDLHPKFRQARMLIAETLGIDEGDRVIVFTESRDTAESLTEFLGEHFDTHRFVGQADAGESKGMTQTAQQEVLDAFRAGGFDVLVSTSVAEEGLDVPEVDLVLFYEPVPTAIRSIQRKGRTGRQTEGRVVVLIAEETRDEAFFWKAQHEEDRMREELRTLKQLAPDVEAELEGEDSVTEIDPDEIDRGARAESQAGLSDFEAADDEEATVATARGDPSAVEIVADQRELDATIARDLSTRDDLEIRLETLAVGDYVLSDRVVVERKTIPDFLATLTGEDRSLFEQARDMARHYGRPVVLIEGEGDLYAERNVHPNAIRGALASLAVDFGASVLRTRDADDTADLLEVIATREQEESDREASVHGEKGARTLAEQQEYVVSAIAEVGPVTARALLESFGTVEAVMAADESALQTVEGIGKVTAERIHEVASTEYEP